MVTKGNKVAFILFYLPFAADHYCNCQSFHLLMVTKRACQQKVSLGAN